MGFHDLLNTLQNPGDDGYPDTIWDDIRQSYDDDTSTRDAKIAELEAGAATHAEELQGRESEISRLKAMNFDLIQSQKQDTEDGGENAGGTDEDNEDGDEEKGGIDSLFGGDD